MNQKPLLEHLDELLIRSRRALFWVILGVGVGYYFADRALGLIEAPLLGHLKNGAQLVYTSPFEKFWAYLRVATLLGLTIVLPPISWEFASFIGPGLEKQERRRILWLVISTSVVFGVGVVLGYLYVLPAILNAVFDFASGASHALPFFTLSAYINTALGILLFSALFMEVPVLMIHFTAWGWVDAAFWQKGRRIAIVLNALASAILSPPDVLSMILMMLPLQVLYECGILGARMAQWISHDTKREEVL